MQKFYFILHFPVLSNYQRYNKESLSRRLKNYLSTDWLPDDKTQSFPLKDYSVNLNFYKNYKHVLGDKLKPLTGLCKLFEEKYMNPGPTTILLIGTLYFLLLI